MKTKSIGLGLVGAVVLVGGGLAGFQAYIQHEAEQRVAAEVRELPPGVQLDYGDVEVGLFGRGVTVKDLRLHIEGNVPLTVNAVDVIEYDHRNDPPHYLHARAVGIQQATDSAAAAQPDALSKLGYAQVRGSYELKYRYDPATRRLDLQKLNGVIEDMGALNLRMTLDNVDLGRQSGAQLPSFELRQFVLSYTDHSLLRRVIAQGAREQGVSEAEFVAALQRQIGAQTAAMKDPFFAELGETLSAFLNEPGTLTVSAAPPQSVPVMEIVSTAMIQFNELPKLLNLTVDASR